MRIKLLGILAASSLLLLGGQAWASHKAWFLKHGGAECSFMVGMVHPLFGGDGGEMFLNNHASWNRSAICPINAAGRWGSSGTTAFNPARWAEAKRAYVHVYNNNPNESVTCQAVARLRVSFAPGGSLYYGTARSVSGVGAHTIELIQTVNSMRSWGGALETNESARLRSLDFQCTVPGNQDGTFPSSYVRGYGAAFCQFGAGNCFDSGGDDFQEWETYIQGNGANCTSGAAGVFRGADGLTSTQNSPFNPTAVICPIVPPSQDSKEHNAAFLKDLRLYFAGSGSAGCEQAQTCPQCVLQWEDRDGGIYNESLMFTWNSNGYLSMPSTANGTSNPLNMKADSSTAIRCYVPAQQRIRGFTARASQTRVSGGQ
jgi:hypothetical protein